MIFKHAYLVFNPISSIYLNFYEKKNDQLFLFIFNYNNVLDAVKDNTYFTRFIILNCTFTQIL